jgi:uroporphyrinogen-III synthase
VRLLVTRPEPDGERTAGQLRAHGHDVMVAALLHVETVAFELADEAYAAVVMTSANAARAVAGHPQRERLTWLPVFTVGRHTAEAAQAAGFRDVRSADGDKHDLAHLLGAVAGGKPLLYLAGEDRSGDLSAGKLPMRTVVAYRAVKAERFPPAVAAAFAAGKLDGVLHFSGRSAEAYVDCATRAGILGAALAPILFCLSRQVAAPLAAAGATQIRVSPRPDEAAIIGLVNST